MSDLQKGKYRVRPAQSESELHQVQTFRAQCFGLGVDRDADALDDACSHIMIEESVSQTLVCCFRTLDLTGAGLGAGYCAQYYDLSALESYEGQILELGRFCIDPARSDPDILRLAWATLVTHVERRNIRMLIGCTSFAGVDPEPYRDAFALIRAVHLAPAHWAPGSRAAETFGFAADVAEKPVKGKALQQMPPLLRSYLTMGAWVSDHAVIDRALNTLHVFTGLEIAAIPPKRLELLRAI